MYSAPMQAVPPGHALVALRYGRQPSPDGVCTIRCNCLHGCRLRCPLGRRVVCAACSSPVGPCCGIRWPGARTAEVEQTADNVVCHACIGDSPARPCQRVPPPSDFPLMSSAQTLRWKSFMELREAQRAELMWRDLNGEVQTSSGQRVAAPLSVAAIVACHCFAASVRSYFWLKLKLFCPGSKVVLPP